jgi:hypothetical protein
MSSDPMTGASGAATAPTDLADASRRLLEQSFNIGNFELIDQLVAAEAPNHMVLARQLGTAPPEGSVGAESAWVFSDSWLAGCAGRTRSRTSANVRWPGFGRRCSPARATVEDLRRLVGERSPWQPPFGSQRVLRPRAGLESGNTCSTFDPIRDRSTCLCCRLKSRPGLSS